MYSNLSSNKSLTSILISFFLIGTVLTVNQYGTQYLLSFTSVFCLIVILFTFKYLDQKSRGKLFILILISIFSTLYSLDRVFSFYQIIRSQMWTIFCPIVLIGVYNFCSKFYSRKLVNILIETTSLYISILALLELSDIILSTNITPAYIRTETFGIESLRLYPIGYEIIFPFLPLFYIYKKWFALFSSFIIIDISGGKTLFLMLITSCIFIFIFCEKNRRNKFIFLIIGILASSLIYIGMQSRLDELYNEGDSRRFDQISDAYNVIGESPLLLLGGIGFGTQYSIGYEEYSNQNSSTKDLDNLLENSKYDVENGYLFFLLRFGILGTILFFAIIWGSIGFYTYYLILYILIISLGGSIVGPSATLVFALFGASAVLINKNVKI